MKNLKIIFMGTPDFAVASLKALVEAGEDVVGVITAPDRPAGRGQKLRMSAVKEYALSQNLTILQPTNLKNSDFLSELKSLNANLQIVVAFRMLPEAVWRMPDYGTFNLHASLLPDYRGAAPINWAIINGEEKTGATTFFIDEKIDTGAIIMQQELAINKTENAGSLHDRLMELGSGLILKTVDAIRNETITTEIQSKTSNFKTAHKLDRENTRIDWELSAEKIHDLIRGLSPYPVAWTEFENNAQKGMMKISKGKIADSTIFEGQKNDMRSLLVHDKGLFVKCKNGYLELTEIQLPGKRKMETKSLLNGYSFGRDAKVL